MKKIFCISAIALAAIMAAPVASELSAAETTVCSQGTTVQITCFRGSMKIRNKATVETTSDGMVAYFGGSSYSVRYSDRNGYDYMFSTSTTTWYFNL